MRLVSENFRDGFGDIRLQVIFQDKATRLSCIRKVADDEALSLHVVLFTEAGVRALGPVHDKIVAGEMLGEVIQASGVPYTRTVSEKISIEIDPALASLFATPESRCAAERIEYHVCGVPYATIYEFYNPKYTRADGRHGTPDRRAEELTKEYLAHISPQLKSRTPLD